MKKAFLALYGAFADKEVGGGEEDGLLSGADQRQSCRTKYGHPGKAYTECIHVAWKSSLLQNLFEFYSSSSRLPSVLSPLP